MPAYLILLLALVCSLVVFGAYLALDVYLTERMYARKAADAVDEWNAQFPAPVRAAVAPIVFTPDPAFVLPEVPATWTAEWVTNADARVLRAEDAEYAR